MKHNFKISPLPTEIANVVDAKYEHIKGAKIESENLVIYNNSPYTSSDESVLDILQKESDLANVVVRVDTKRD